MQILIIMTDEYLTVQDYEESLKKLEISLMLTLSLLFINENTEAFSIGSLL
jgi:hypothetical protein